VKLGYERIFAARGTCFINAEKNRNNRLWNDRS
jgi:hypothetical protein